MFYNNSKSAFYFVSTEKNEDKVYNNHYIPICYSVYYLGYLKCNP